MRFAQFHSAGYLPLPSAPCPLPLATATATAPEDTPADVSVSASDAAVAVALMLRVEKSTISVPRINQLRKKELEASATFFLHFYIRWGILL